jgi:hypothetical protein
MPAQVPPFLGRCSSAWLGRSNSATATRTFRLPPRLQGRCLAGRRSAVCGGVHPPSLFGRSGTELGTLGSGQSAAQVRHSVRRRPPPCRRNLRSGRHSATSRATGNEDGPGPRPGRTRVHASARVDLSEGFSTPTSGTAPIAHHAQTDTRRVGRNLIRDPRSGTCRAEGEVSYCRSGRHDLGALTHPR